MKAFLLRALGFLQGMPKDAASHLHVISERADQILGPSTQHLHERYSPDIHIDLLHYAPSGQRDFHYLLTSGVSDRPAMEDGQAVDAPRIELAMALPAHWDVSAQGFEDPATWEPLRLLKAIARYGAENGTFLAKYHSIPLGNAPLLSPFAAVLLMPPVLLPELREPIPSREGDIHVLAVYLMHPSELEAKQNGQMDLLFEKFGEHAVSELFDLSRPPAL